MTEGCSHYYGHSLLRTLAITDTRYYGHSLLRTLAITDTRYYGHSLLRTPNFGPDCVGNTVAKVDCIFFSTMARGHKDMLKSSTGATSPPSKHSPYKLANYVICTLICKNNPLTSLKQKRQKSILSRFCE